jgi:hypothetical protein
VYRRTYGVRCLPKVALSELGAACAQKAAQYVVESLPYDAPYNIGNVRVAIRSLLHDELCSK